MGLMEIGDDCLQLVIEDGGPNDADGVANGVVIDPSGIAEKFIGTPSSNSSAVLGNEYSRQMEQITPL